MSVDRIERSLGNLEQAVLRLKEALEEPESDPLTLDGTIQRFEFVFELSWKTLMHMLEAEGLTAAGPTATTPRAVIREAYKAQWIDNEAAWLQMLNDRNDTSHTYNVALARKIYGHIRDNFSTLANATASFRAWVDKKSDGA